MLRKNFPGRKNQRREVAINNMETALNRRNKEIETHKNNPELVKELKTTAKNLRQAIHNTKLKLV